MNSQARDGHGGGSRFRRDSSAPDRGWRQGQRRRQLTIDMQGHRLGQVAEGVQHFDGVVGPACSSAKGKGQQSRGQIDVGRGKMARTGPLQSAHPWTRSVERQPWVSAMALASLVLMEPML